MSGGYTHITHLGPNLRKIGGNYEKSKAPPISRSFLDPGGTEKEWVRGCLFSSTIQLGQAIPLSMLTTQGLTKWPT